MAINSSAKNVIPIGVVLSIAGYVALKGTDGLQKILQLGDLLRSDDHIKTGPDGELVIGFIDGTALELGAKIEAILDSEVFDLSALKPISNLEEALEAMRLSILTGEDPSLVLQSAEAGYDSLSAAGSEPAGVNIDSTSDSASVTVEDSLANTTMQGGSVSQSAMGADSGVHTPPEMVLPKVSIASVTILEPTPGNPEEDADEGHDTTDTGHDTGDGHDTGGDTGHDTDTGHETDTGGGTDSGHDSGNDAGHSAGHGGGYGYAGDRKSVV